VEEKTLTTGKGSEAEGAKGRGPAACDGQHKTDWEFRENKSLSPDEPTASVGSWEAVDER